jgi:hypothetical protein
LSSAGETTQGKDSPPSPYRSDASQRIDVPEHDPLGHRDFADALVAALAIAPSQFTIGLFGPWGTGKSTILTEVGRQFDEADNNTAFVVFDAWRYDGDSLRREFIRSVGKELKDKGAAPGYDPERETKAFDVEVTRPRAEPVGLSWRSLGHPLGTAITALLVIGFGYLTASALDLSKQTILDAEIAVLSALTAFVLAAANRSLTPVEVRETKRRVEYPDQFAASFSALLREVKAERLVIGIDNLDRCSPARVAEILSTVKTFLEPPVDAEGEGSIKSICFVIAADDGALRRHLAGQENASGAQDGPEHAVDEYLRKLFNATIRITDTLMEDMKAFTAREIEDFIVNHPELQPGASDQLVEMAAQALKHNPRRMKQFINNLELRLQLFAQRRGSKRIQIEPDVLMVAKLAILEEEFPDYHAQLCANPRMLAQWQEEVARADPSGNLDEALVAFLRFTARVKSEDVRPYLTLKQSSDERDLPGYGELVALLEDGSSEGLRRLLDENGELECSEYVEAARRYFEEQVRERSWSRAGNALRALTEVESLHQTEVVDHILDIAVDHQPNLERRLPDLDPTILLQAARAGEDGERFTKVLRVLLAGAAEGEGAERRRPLFSALAAFDMELSKPDAKRVAKMLAGETVRQDFDSYALLAEARPELLGVEVLVAALDQLTTNPDLIQAGAPAFRVAVAGLGRSGADDELRERLLTLARDKLQAMRGSEGVELGKLHVPLTTILNAKPSSPGVLRLAQDIVESWESSEQQSRWVEIGVGLRLCSKSELIDESVGTTLGGLVLDLEGPTQVGEWAAEQYRSMAKNFKAGFRQRLVAALSGSGQPDAANAEEVADALSEQASKILYGEAVRQAVAKGRLENAGRCLTKASKQAGEEAMSIAVQSFRETPPGAGPKQKALLDFVLSNQARLASNVRVQLAEQMIGEVLKSPQRSGALAPAIGQIQIGDSVQRTELVKRLLHGLEQIRMPRRRVPIVEAAAGLAGESGPARDLVGAELEKFSKSSSPVEKNLAQRLQKKRGPAGS